jgi:hypothetical protein
MNQFFCSSTKKNLSHDASPLILTNCTFLVFPLLTCNPSDYAYLWDLLDTVPQLFAFLISAHIFAHNYSLQAVISMLYMIVSCTLVPSQLFSSVRSISCLFLHDCVLYACSLTIILFRMFYSLLVLTRLCPVRLFPHNYYLPSVPSLACSYTVGLFPFTHVPLQLPAVLSLACSYTVVSCTFVPSQLFSSVRSIPLVLTRFFLVRLFPHNYSFQAVLSLLVLTRFFPVRLFPHNYSLQAVLSIACSYMVVSCTHVPLQLPAVLVLTRLFPFTHVPLQLPAVLSLACSYTVVSGTNVPSQLFSSVRSIPCLFLHVCFLHEFSLTIILFGQFYPLLVLTPLFPAQIFPGRSLHACSYLFNPFKLVPSHTYVRCRLSLHVLPVSHHASPLAQLFLTGRSFSWCLVLTVFSLHSCFLSQ